MLAIGPMQRNGYAPGTAPLPKGDGDWTVGVRIAMRGGEYLIEDVRRDRLGPAGVDDLIKTTASGDGFDTLIREEDRKAGSSGKSVVDARGLGHAAGVSVPEVVRQHGAERWLTGQ